MPAMPDRGTLERVLIRGYDDPSCADPPQAEFQAYVNPAEITLGYEAEYQGQNGAGTTGSRMHFNRIKPGDLTIAFLIYGTGADGRTVDVTEEIAKFKDATGYTGDKHEPRHLKIAWGRLPIVRSKLKSASIVYKLFTSDGVPLRAAITAVFVESVDDQTRVALAQDHSADLTHVRLVKAGDSLPGLCQLIYGEPRMYLEVARANGLDNFRALPAGTQLRFPPLAK